jgi:hypothetical protein
MLLKIKMSCLVMKKELVQFANDYKKALDKEN